MTKKRIIPINYTSKDFNSIKNDLLTYTKKYYPDTFKDYSESSFGSMVLDTVAYVGDQLSFYLDYNANESYLESALEYDNVVNLARQMGFKYEENFQSYGYVELMVSIPSKDSSNEPDLQYVPKLLKNSTFRTTGGVDFTLTDDVDFLNPNTDIIATVLSNDASRADFYTLIMKGRVVSGQSFTSEFTVGNFEKFRTLEIPTDNVGEIVLVVDAEGHEYQEVDYLSQNVVFKNVKNTGPYRDRVPHLLKPFPCPRRFVVERHRGRVKLLFGHGSQEEIKKNNIVDPSDVAVKMHGKNYVSESVFDPSRLTSTDKFGIAPANTTISVTYRINNVLNTNAASKTLTQVSNAKLYFINEQDLDPAKVSKVFESVSVDNENPINGFTTSLTTEEIKRKAYDTYAMQARAVTRQDYKSAVYAMPSKFGSVKRCAIYRDNDDLRKNINLYTISESESGHLETTNIAIKENLKNWLNNVRMITDTIDILDAKILNIGVEFDIMVEDETNKYEILTRCREKIKEDLTSIYPEIGESFYVTDVFKSLKDVRGVLDVIDVRLVNKTGGLYSSVSIDIDQSMSIDGRKLEIPNYYIWEIKYPNSDIRGTIK